MAGTGTLLPALLRYGQVAAGPVASAACQFLLSLQLLHLLPAPAFGAFSFLMVVSQFSAGIWSALFCAPLPVLLAQGGPASLAAARSLYSASLALAVASLGAFGAAASLLGYGIASAALFAGYAAVVLLRSFARAHAYTEGLPLRTTASDLVFSACLLAGMAAIQQQGGDVLRTANAALALAACASLLPFGRGYFVRQFAQWSWSGVRGYAEVWRRHAAWSLLGVLTTEATVNAHAYIVTALGGPAGFAPVAASALTVRPVGVVGNALSEYERTQLARRLAAADGSERRALRVFRALLAAAWGANALAALALLAWAPRLVFPARYALEFLVAATALWFAVSLVRHLRAPESVLLQAAGAFRPLATASLVSAVVSVACVAALYVAGGALWSIAGVLAGETVFALWTWRQARVFLRARALPVVQKELHP